MTENEPNIKRVCGPVTQLEDKVLTCKECDRDFVFSSGEQLFFHSQQFLNNPVRCKNCQSRRVGEKRCTIATRVQCEQCGIDTTVPFLPRQGRPVYCRTCFSASAVRPPSQQGHIYSTPPV